MSHNEKQWTTISLNEQHRATVKHNVWHNEPQKTTTYYKETEGSKMRCNEKQLFIKLDKQQKGNIIRHNEP